MILETLASERGAVLATRAAPSLQIALSGLLCGGKSLFRRLLSLLSVKDGSARKEGSGPALGIGAADRLERHWRAVCVLGGMGIKIMLEALGGLANGGETTSGDDTGPARGDFVLSDQVRAFRGR